MAGSEADPLTRAQASEAWRAIFSKKRTSKTRQDAETGPQKQQQLQPSSTPTTSTSTTEGRKRLRLDHDPETDLTITYSFTSPDPTRMHAAARQPYDFRPFRRAQDGYPRLPGCATYTQALREMRAGSKTSHWVWYVLPQLRGLSASARGIFFGLRDAQEARAYLRDADGTLRARLLQIVAVVLEAPVKDVEILMGGWVDALKLQACMTLFLRALEGKGEVEVEEEVEEGDQSSLREKMREEDEVARGLFQDVLDKYFDGKTNEETEEILEQERARN